MVYYNEFDPKAAAWLRELIKQGLIADGIVDERSIVDVEPSDLVGYAQCHFFAGIGGWSYALRLAGWPDDRPVWTGSCPCQPFSAAGKGLGFDDERHLWPAFHWLIAQCDPAIVFGEQVASRLGREWLAGVRTDLEALEYAVGGADLCAAGVGAPHIRQRLYWVADAGSERRAGINALLLGRGPQQDRPEAAGSGETGRLGDADFARSQGCCVDAGKHADQRTAWSASAAIHCTDGKSRRVEPIPLAVVDGVSESLGPVRDSCHASTKEEIDAYAKKAGCNVGEAMFHVWLALSSEALERRHVGRQDGVCQTPILLAFLRQLAHQGWAVAQSLPCASSETQEAAMRSLRIELQAARSPHQRGLAGQPAGEHSDPVHILSSILARHAQTAWGEAFDAMSKDNFVLAHGIPARMGRLRGYGNAINPQIAAEFIRAAS